MCCFRSWLSAPHCVQVFHHPDRRLDLQGQNVAVDYRGYEVNPRTFVRLLTGMLITTYLLRLYHCPSFGDREWRKGQGGLPLLPLSVALCNLIFHRLFGSASPPCRAA